MSDDSGNDSTGDVEVDAETDAETDVDAETVEEVDEEVVIDLDAAAEYEQRIDELEATVERQQEQVEELESLLLDLSTRVADGRDIGVCPECHGPVERVRRWFRPSVIKCRRCGEVYHEY